MRDFANGNGRRGGMARDEFIVFSFFFSRRGGELNIEKTVLDN